MRARNGAFLAARRALFPEVTLFRAADVPARQQFTASTGALAVFGAFCNVFCGFCVFRSLCVRTVVDRRRVVRSARSLTRVSALQWIAAHGSALGRVVYYVQGHAANDTDGVLACVHGNLHHTPA